MKKKMTEKPVKVKREVQSIAVLATGRGYIVGKAGIIVPHDNLDRHPQSIIIRGRIISVVFVEGDVLEFDRAAVSILYKVVTICPTKSETEPKSGIKSADVGLSNNEPQAHGTPTS